MVRKFRTRVAARLVALALAAGIGGTAAAVDLDQVVAQRMDVNDGAAQSQVRVDELSGENRRASVDHLLKPALRECSFQGQPSDGLAFDPRSRALDQVRGTHRFASHRVSAGSK